MRTVIVGAGAFGISAALELSRRGHEVRVVDPGPIPHPDAASTDISKVIRADYGSDGFYTELMELALEGWREHNRRWIAAGDAPLYHETGFVLLTSEAMQPGEFEHDSFALLAARGYPLERLDSNAIARRFPVWKKGRFVDGYYNPIGGWAQSGAIVASLAQQARAAGIELHEGFRFAGLTLRGDAATGAHDAAGNRVEGDAVVVCAGTWTSKLVPELADRLRSVGQPVMVFRPDDASPFAPPRMVPWGADIARTGWYGFCANGEGLVKMANHGPGRVVDPDEPRTVTEEEAARFRSFIRDALPSLVDAPVAFTRLCLYSDSFDGDFIIDRHPRHPGLVVAAGGSGHAFKFMPALGGIVADVVEGRSNRFADRFRWREVGDRKTEAARFDGDARRKQ
jgi:glycine/D-amino acid oxidase-like deaminating enzyme